MEIKSILDTDLYKFTTSYAYMKLFPHAEGTFTFCDRNKIKYDDKFLYLLRKELSNLGSLRLKNSELDYCKENIKFLPECYWEWLSGFSFNPNKIRVWLEDEGRLCIEVTDLLYKVTLYEVPILAIVSYVTNVWLDRVERTDSLKLLTVLRSKINYSNVNILPFSEFGTRRRFSYDVQDMVCKTLKEESKWCTGTSNVYLAMKYDMKPMGTHPHEWFMFHGAVFGYKQANYLALENWVETYDGYLGIALSDTFTSDAFLRNFSCKHAKLFDGVRHDSGNPYDFTDKVIKRYEELGIDPKTKTIIFSDGLTMKRFKDISLHCQGKIRCAAGIGTHLTNDTDFPAPNIVMKLSKCRINNKQPWCNTVKLSDVEGKHMGLENEIEICKYECGV